MKIVPSTWNDVSFRVVFDHHSRDRGFFDENASIALPPEQEGRAMPRFQFNVYDGNDGLDRKEPDLPDLRTAQIEAIAMAGAILRERARFCGSMMIGAWK